MIAMRIAAFGGPAAMFDAGKLAPWVGALLPLGEARTAHEMLEGTRPRAPGKIVLAVAGLA